MIASVNSLTTPRLANWLKLYNLTFLAGIAISFTAMSGLCYIFPPPGLGIDEPFIEGEVEGIEVRGKDLEGVGGEKGIGLVG